MDPKIAKQAQDSQGMPRGMKVFSPAPFGGINAKDSPPAISDSEFVWTENFLSLGNNKFRTVWDVGAPDYTAGSLTIVYAFQYTRGTLYYRAIFFSDGSAVEYNMATAATTRIGVAGTFYTIGGLLPACTQWGTQYLLIANRNTVNDYWVWDGALLYAAGGAAPNGVDITATGQGYNSLPSVTVYGGHGTGMSVTPFINAGGVVNVKIDTPGSGYQTGDVVQLAFSGGGTNDTPILEAILNAGNIAAVNVTAGGSGYTSAPTVSFSGGGGTGAAGTAIVSAALSSITVAAPGTGYSQADVEITGGGGSGATALASISNGIIGIAVGSGGVNYTFANVTLTGGGGSGASAVAIITGGVTSVSVTSVGTGYTSAPSVNFTGGGGSGATAVASISGTVSSTNVTAGGIGYTSAPTVVFSGGGGTGAAGTANISAGAVTSITITNSGIGYTSAPTISFSGGGGSGATATASITSGVISVFVTNAGSGYTSPPAVSFSGGGGSGAAAISKTIGAISAISVVNAGVGYTSAPAVNISGDGTGATATASFASGGISSITLLTPGSGYTSAPTVTITGNGTGASATAVLASGAVTGVNITAGGNGYTSAPTISFSGGGGTGASATAILAPTGVKGVNVINGGNGFVYAPTITFKGGGGVGAAGIAVLTPTSIEKVNVVSPGTGYTQPPDVKLIGTEGAASTSATAVVQGGGVVAINLTNGGSGYTGNIEVIITPNKADKDTASGAAATASLVPTSIASVLMSNYGTNYTSAPAVIVTPGANNSAYAQVSLMPYGVSGSAIETYQQRVWIADPDQQPYATTPPEGNFQVSAPGSLTDFATSDGGVQFTNSDSFLQTRYNAIKQSNGYLYFFGDGSVSVVSGVTTSGSPATTSFNYQSVELQEGLQFRDAISDFGKSILYMNQTGVYGLYGGSAANVSESLQDIFDNAIFPPTAGAVTPSAATVTIHNIKWTVRLMTVKDPDTLRYRTVMIAWDEKKWHVLSQSVNLTYIWSQKVGSLFKAFGTDGTSIYQLFASPSSSLIKRFTTKVFGAGQDSILLKELHAFYAQGQDQTAVGSGINLDIDFVFSGQTEQSDTDPSDANATISASADFGTGETFLLKPLSFSADNPYWPIFGTGSIGGQFVSVQARVSTTSPDFILGGLMLTYTTAGIIG